MTLMNRLIKEAHLKPSELVISPNEIKSLSECVSRQIYPPSDIKEIENSIRKGELKLLGISVRVKG